MKDSHAIKIDYVLIIFKISLSYKNTQEIWSCSELTVPIVIGMMTSSDIVCDPELNCKVFVMNAIETRV